jgi:hypothetical protein
MPWRENSRPRGALIIVAVVLCTILAIYDLSSPNSVLTSFWNQITRSPTQGEQLRDDILNQIPTRR